MPMVRSVSGIRAWSVSMTKEAKYRPAASVMTVTEVGVVGSVRDHFTFTAPIFTRFRRSRRPRSPGSRLGRRRGTALAQQQCGRQGALLG
jgi:hypothetical protein